MRTITVLIFVSIAVAAVGAGCGGSDTPGSEEVVAAFYPLAFLAENVAPDAEVRNLTPPGAEPHDLELSPRDIGELRDARLVLYLGGGFMPALEDAVSGRANAVDLLAGAPRVIRPTATRMFGWIRDGTRAAARRSGRGYSAILAAADSARRPARAGSTQSSATGSSTATAARSSRATPRSAPPSAYGLEQVALTGLSPEAEPSPRRLQALVEQIRHENGATTVFFETLVSPKLAETVAREAGAQTAVLDPLEGLTDGDAERGADYFTVMRRNLAALRAALGCR